jgi:predicted HicB family RNase H-like nuclease
VIRPVSCFSSYRGLFHAWYCIYDTSAVQGDYWACRLEFRKYNTGMKNKGGRPLRDPSEGASKIVPIRMTGAEHQRYQDAAEQAKLSLSEWARDRLDKAAKRESKR